MKKRTVSLMLILCLILSCLAGANISASAMSAPTGADTAAASTGKDYGPPQSCEGGNILHCFNWTLNQIKEELPNIAEAGFTSVQTSPLQAHTGSYQWYWLYQPNGFSIGNEIGSYDDLKSLCTEADKYGIKVIVDVVANHLAGSNSGTWASSIDNNLKKSEYFHNLGAGSNWNDRYEVTHKNIGMPDLNSENTQIQEIVASMISRLQSAGVDGIRWDAAKHISLPSEECGFWSRMAQFDLFQYGEVLDAPAGNSSDSINNPLMQEYSQYIGITDEKYSTAIMSAVRGNSIYKTDGYWLKRDIAPERLVYWAESHDTYSNDPTEGGWTKDIDQSDIDKAYAILGAKADSQALYLSRPSEKNKSSIRLAQKGSTHFTSKAVAAVNHFHNAMVGTAEQYSTSGGCYVVWREGGAVLVSIRSSDTDVSVNNKNAMVPEGTYTDEVSGSTFTVTSSKITGHIGDTGIAVIYGKKPDVKDILIGDTSLDGEIEVDDATLIQRHVALIRELSNDEAAAADTDLDGIIALPDATAIQRYLAQMSSTGSHIGEHTVR